MQRFRKWSVRKLRRRPRSHDKFDGSNRNKSSTLTSVKENQHSLSSDDSKDLPFDSLGASDRGKKVDRSSMSSEDSAILDLKNESTLYGKIMAISTNDNRKIQTKRMNSEPQALSENQTSNDSPEMPNKSSIGESNSSIAKKLTNNLTSKEESRSEAEPSSKTCDSSENKDAGSEKHTEEKILESDVLLFGCDLPKPMIEGSLELSSDQDSTAGEDEEFADEEDIENLHPDMLLYKAAAAHNLPVMCVALAAGADKMWSNVNDRGRNAMHQAIISVSQLNYQLF